MVNTFSQFFRYAVIGVVNTLIDWGVLNVLLFTTRRTDAVSYALFKSLSFCLAMTNSYFLNKSWTFKDEDGGVNSAATLMKAGKFVLVNLVGLGINASLASLVASRGYGQADFILWANLGAVAATAASLVWNFFGYKFLVFKK